MQKIKPIFVLLVLVTGVIASPNLAFAQVQLSAEDDAYSVNEDTTLTVGPIGVLLNDTNTGSETFVAIIMTDAGFGTLKLNEDGSFTYTPFENFADIDTFTYVANNGTDNSNEATVTVTVNPVNDPPNAEDDEYTTEEGMTLAIVAPGILKNDTDVEDDSLTATLDSFPSHGDVTLNADGSFEYIPDTNFDGTDSFTYHANDGNDNSNIAEVTINVNPKDPDFDDSILDQILEQLETIFNKIFDLENEVAQLREENAALESRVTELETIIQNGFPHNDDDDDNEIDSKKQLKKEIKALKKEFKEQKKQLKNEYKEKEKELKKQLNDLKKDKKSDDDDDKNEDDDDDDDD